MRLRRHACIALCLAALASCRVFQEDAAVAAGPPPIESADFGRMRNVSHTGDLWFGSSPCKDDLNLARRRGVRTVIDLSLADEVAPCDVRGVSAEFGLRYFDLGLTRIDFLNDETVDLVLEKLRDPASGPYLMFCGTGGRCAMLVAIHRVVDQGVTLDVALEEARHAGMDGGAQADFVRAQVARLTASEDAAASDDEAPADA